MTGAHKVWVKAVGPIRQWARLLTYDVNEKKNRIRTFGTWEPVEVVPIAIMQEQ